MPLLHLQKNSKCNPKLEYFSRKYDVSMMSYQNSGVILSKFYCINATYHFWMNSVLPIWRPILYWRKNSKCNIIVAYGKYVNIVWKITNLVKSDSRHHFCKMIPSLFLRHLLDLQKNFQIIHQILIFSPKIWQLLCVNIFIETQVRSYQKSIRVSLEKMAGAHRSFFLGYKDAYKKLTFMQGFFTPDIKFYSSQRNVLSCYGSNWHQAKS